MTSKLTLHTTATNMLYEMRGNCAQAIFATYGPQIGGKKLDNDLCMNIASTFGGGINRTGNVCGAITGALMVLGFSYGENIQKVTRISNQFIDEFKSIHGSIICRELIDDDLFNIEDLKKAFQEGAFNKCVKCVDDSARLLEKLLEREEN